MSLSVIPTNIGGFSLPFAQLQGPLSSLFQNQNPQNLMYPSDLGANPSMGHAVLFQVFDYKSGFTDKAKTLIEALPGAAQAAVAAAKSAEGGLLAGATAIAKATADVIGQPAAKLLLAATTAASYERKTKTRWNGKI